MIVLAGLVMTIYLPIVYEHFNDPIFYVSAIFGIFTLAIKSFELATRKVGRRGRLGS